MPGPAPKDPSTRARRNDPRKGFRSLPKGGRPGPVPAWPLGPDITMLAELEFARDQVAKLQVDLAEESDGRARGRIRRNLDKAEMQVTRLGLTLEMSQDAEKALWAEEWTKPQAVLWEENHAHRVVASYVRWKIREEQGDLKAASEVRQLGDRLGMTPLSLARMQSEVEHADEAADKGDQRRQAKKTPAKKTAAKKSARSSLYAV